MNATQWNYIKTRLFVLGGIGVLALIAVGIVYEWAVVFYGLLLATLALVGYGIAIWIAIIMYRWRVMGATADDEMCFFESYWPYTIKDGHTDSKIYDIEMHYVGEDWDEEYRQQVHDYLIKIDRVPRPKILDV